MCRDTRGETALDRRIAGRRLWKAWEAYRKGLSEAASRGVPGSCRGKNQRAKDLPACNPKRKKSEILPPPMEIVAGLPECEREILAIVEELDELLSHNQEDGENHEV